MHYEKNTRKSIRADIERQKQEEIANARVRQVDSHGRAYGTGKRKCQIGAIRLGMSRELQNWAPDQFHPPLKEVHTVPEVCFYEMERPLGPLSSLSFHIIIFEGDQ
ncbi:hypothetical protein Tco_1270874 [Tanacetum coccineum]